MTSSTALFSFHGGHTHYVDGSGRAEDFIRAAIKRGLVAFGFTEHMPPPEEHLYPGQESLARLLADFERYVDEISELKRRYEGQIEVLLGMEAEYIPSGRAYLKRMLEAYPFDYVVGSVHFVYEIGFDYSPEWYRRALERAGSLEQLFIDYYALVREVVEMDRFQILGHLDLIKVFAGRVVDSPAVQEAEAKTLDVIAQHDIVLDLNARGLIKPCKEQYPRKALLEAACQRGISVTLGDDSHAPGDVGQNLPEMVQLARLAGYRTLVRLTKESGVPQRVEVLINTH